MTELAPVLHFVDHFQRRILQDALDQATSAYWRKRAEAFEAARPRPGEFFGRASREEIQERDARLAGLAENCRRRAALALMDDPMKPEPPPVLWCDACGTPTSPWTCSCGGLRVGEAG